jgi:large subunit ribosomal protein L31e
MGNRKNRRKGKNQSCKTKLAPKKNESVEATKLAETEKIDKEEPEEEETVEKFDEEKKVEEAPIEEVETAEELKEAEEKTEELEEEEAAEEVTEEVKEAEEEEVEEEEVKKEKKEEAEEEIVEERIYTIPLSRAWISPPKKRTPRAVRIVKSFIQKHMKIKTEVEEEDEEPEKLVLSNEVNQKIWSRGIKEPPRNIRVRAVKDKEGVITVYLAEGD